MKIDISKMIPISKVNQNFSEAVKKVDENGTIVIMKQNQPKYVMMTIEEYENWNLDINRK